VAAFYDMLKRDHTFSYACTVLRCLGAAGLRRLLELGVLEHLLPRLDEDTGMQYAALGLLLPINSIDHFAHAPLLASHGIVGKLIGWWASAKRMVCAGRRAWCDVLWQQVR
jgi:hypothetical protein